ncbi:MAG: AAA family ATPase, partial [Bdellovibrionia bacterium]
MKIDQLRLENFKIFKKATINFRPITILAGANSSGKSTILNAITSVMQTSPSLFPFKYFPNGKTCQLGGYRDIVFGKNIKSNFSIGLSVSAKTKQMKLDSTFRYSPRGNQILPQRFRFTDDDDTISVEWIKERYVARIDNQSFNRLRSDETPEEFMKFFDSLNAIVAQMESEQGAKDVRDIFEKQPKTAFPLNTKNPLEILSELSKTKPASIMLLNGLIEFMTGLGNLTTYLGPVRAYPSRYYQAELADAGMDKMGKNAVSILFEWKNYDKPRFQAVLAMLQLLQLASKVSASTGLEDVIRLNVQPYRHREMVNIADSGFGLSQVLPILVADAAFDSQGTLLVNQPEVHLHPSSQAQLANHIVSRLKRRQYIVETHSEYLINRLRLLVVKGKLKREDVSIVYFDKPVGKGGARVREIELGETGELHGAP